MQRFFGEVVMLILLSIVMAMIAPDVLTAVLLGAFISGPIVAITSNLVWGRRVRKDNKDASV